MIQKNLGKKVLTEEELQNHIKEAKAMLMRETAIWGAALYKQISYRTQRMWRNGILD